MAVYVDRIIDYGWKLGPSCHLTATTVDELHRFARKIGMKREWFQDKKTPHYDLTEKRRADALAKGAYEVVYVWLAPTYDYRETMRCRLVVPHNNVNDPGPSIEYFDVEDGQWIGDGDCGSWVIDGMMKLLRRRTGDILN